MRARDNKLALLANGESPNLTMMSIKLLNHFKLKKAGCRQSAINTRPISSLPATYLIAVPVLDRFVLAGRPEVMAVLFEHNLHDALVVGKNGLVAVSKVETPDLDVLIRRARDEKLRVRRDIHRKDGQLMVGSIVSPEGNCRKVADRLITNLVPVEREEELERVLVEDLDRRVEERDGEQPTIRRVSNRENVVGHLECPSVDEREDLGLELKYSKHEVSVRSRPNTADGKSVCHAPHVRHPCDP